MADVKSCSYKTFDKFHLWVMAIMTMSDNDMETEHGDGDDDEFDHDVVGIHIILIDPTKNYFSVCQSQKMSSFCIYLSVC